jgi:hypothetical protein
MCSLEKNGIQTELNKLDEVGIWRIEEEEIKKMMLMEDKSK